MSLHIVSNLKKRNEKNYMINTIFMINYIRDHKDNLDYNEEYDQNGINFMKRERLPLVAFPEF